MRINKKNCIKEPIYETHTPSTEKKGITGLNPRPIISNVPTFTI